jgi:hypothetical protein
LKIRNSYEKVEKTALCGIPDGTVFSEQLQTTIQLAAQLAAQVQPSV